MTIDWQAVEQYFTVELFNFQFHTHTVCNFGKFIKFAFGAVRGERVN